MRQTIRYRKVLRGLEGITVWVHEIDQKAAEAGLSRQHLQDALVVRLLDSGVRALGIGNVPEPPGNPWLNVFVHALPRGSRFFYFVTMRLTEVVRPERNKITKTVGTTWETFETGIEEKDRLPATIERALNNLADYFIYDYHSENRR